MLVWTKDFWKLSSISPYLSDASSAVAQTWRLPFQVPLGLLCLLLFPKYLNEHLSQLKQHSKLEFGIMYLCKLHLGSDWTGSSCKLHVACIFASSGDTSVQMRLEAMKLPSICTPLSKWSSALYNFYSFIGGAD